jgi:hypothetical protein
MANQPENRFNYLTIGRIVNINYATGSCDLATSDVGASERKAVPYPLPYAGKGWGVLVGPEEGSQVGFFHIDRIVDILIPM